jgi:hypothetical protein
MFDAKPLTIGIGCRIEPATSLLVRASRLHMLQKVANLSICVYLSIYVEIYVDVSLYMYVYVYMCIHIHDPNHA